MMLPNFLCIGAPKSGTTSLYDVLKQHKDVFLPKFKEPHFFDSNKSWNKGVAWYQASYYSKASHQCVGDFTPTYLSNSLAPGRIQKVLGNQVKFVVILRNPIDRAYSHYQMEVSSGNEKLSFDKAIDEEKNRISLDMEKMNADENFYSVNFYRKSYLTRGIYVDQIKRWFKYFPRNQFLIIQSEDLYSDTSKIYSDVLNFLNLPKFELDSFKAHRMRKYSEISTETRKKLVDYFKPYNKQLYELLNRNFNWENE